MVERGWRLAAALLFVIAGNASDDHGETPETATLLELGGPPLPGSLAGGSDVDVFRLDVVGRASVEVRTSGRTDTRGELLDDSGARLASDDNSGAGAGNFRIAADLEPGIYYVEVAGGPGGYSISARLADAADHGDTAATATLLTLYNETDLAEVSPNALLATSGRIWPSRNDVDVFRLDVVQDASEVTIRTAGSADTFGRVLDGALNQLAANDRDGSFRIEVRLDAGTYYVEVGGHEVGVYRVLAWNSGEPCRCDAALPGVDRSIIRYLTDLIDEGESPGLIAAIVDADGIRAIAADGIRRVGSPEPLLVTDHVHLGSNTKAMTSVMLATLVADGTFEGGWGTTIGDVFPELMDEIEQQYVNVTLWQLVSMASGLRMQPVRASSTAASIVERRYAVVRANLASPPAAAVGTYHYSNVGYIVAGAMAERVSGASWEDLMRERLFAPLDMSSAGFGAPGTLGEVDQPWGHRRDSEGEWEPNQVDNPTYFGPAGTVHVSLEDWAKFVALWLPESPPAILDRGVLDRLIRPTSGNYAAGWGVWASGRGPVLSHNGTNLSWFATVQVRPEDGRAYLVAANSAKPDYWETGELLQRIVSDLREHVRGPDSGTATVRSQRGPWNESEGWTGPGLLDRKGLGAQR